ncbi:MAG: ABC transporter permease, partial [Planctomycetota bacterium]
TVVMVAVAVGLILVLLSMRDSSRQAFARGAGNMHMLVTRDASPLVSVLNAVFYADPPRQPISWDRYERLSRELPLEYAIPVQQGDSYRGFPVLASDEAFFTAYEPNLGEPWAFAEGGPYAEPFDVVIGSGAARATGLSVGDEIVLTHGVGLSQRAAKDAGDSMKPHEHGEYTFTVSGILEPTGGPHDRALFAMLEASWVIHAHDRRLREDPSATTTLADIVAADRLITSVYLRVFTRGGSQMSGAQQQVFDILRSDPSLTVASPGDEIEKLFQIVGNVDQIFLGMAAIVMVSSGIAILLALYNSMEQRRRQIAILRVLGCSRSRVFGLIVSESAIIGIFGAALGTVLAFAGGVAVAGILKARLGLVVEPMIPPDWIFIVGMGALIISAIAGIIPGVMGYRTEVVRSLRPTG